MRYDAFVGRFYLACSIVYSLAACAPVGPNYHQPDTPVTPKFVNADQPGIAGTQTETSWWRGFKDAELNRLIADALLYNHDLRIATANLREARSLYQESTRDLYPTGGLNASYVDRQRSAFSVPGIPTQAERTVELWNVGFDANWELDFFGRVRRSIEARNADMQSLEASRRDVLVSLIAEIARNYFELRGTQNQLAVARKNAENQQATVRLTLARLEGGRGTELDVSRAREQLNSTLANIPPWEATIQRIIHRLSVLTGQQPGVLTTSLSKARPLPSAPALVTIGNPAELLRRRPDIQSAERGLAATTARIGVSVADFFPRVTFSANVALEANDILSLGSSGSDVYSFGPAIRWTGLDRRRIRARVGAAEARTEAQLARYEKTVLLALEETENALVNFGKQQNRRNYLQAAARESEKAHELAHIRFDGGMADFLTVLDAERRLLEAQDRLAQSQTATATALVAVYKALGGGWENYSVAGEKSAAR